jgi:Xaa-Pro aminopeptidase
MSGVPNSIIREKVQQAVGLLREHNLPMWIAQFAQETDLHPEPCQDLLIGTSVTWPSAFIIQADGTTTAIVGSGDVTNVERVGAYERVIGYIQDVAPELVRVITNANPTRIGISTSTDDFAADCITLGKYRKLESILADTHYADRLVSAEPVLAALRARKLPSEVERIRRAIEATLTIFSRVEAHLAPGMTERELEVFIHGLMRAGGLASAWDLKYDPVVNFGPASPTGHAAPSDIVLEPGHLIHVDLGVKVEGYCSDLQRTWYLAHDSETAPPTDVQRAFDTLVRSLAAGFEALRVGIPGWQIDMAAREVLLKAGYLEPPFALGHQLGQNAHDGAGLLGPRWPRYGRTPDYPIEPNSVYTLEFALSTSAGLIGLEEDVLVTETGAQYLSPPQTTLPVLHAASR